MSVVDILIIAIYLVVLFIVGIYARIKINTVDDYLVAGNRISIFSLVGTILASLMGAGMVMGVVGDIFNFGAGILWNYIGLAAGYAVFGWIYVGKLRKTEKRTMAEIISGRFGRMPRFVVAIFAAVYAFSFLALGVTGMARLLTYVFGDKLSITAATVIAVMIGIIFTALGGLYSVVWTDTIQFILMVVILVIVGPVIAVNQAGSFEAINSSLSKVGGTLTNPVRNVPVTYIMTAFMTMLLDVPGDPTIPQRSLAGKDTKTVRRAFYLAAAIEVLFGIGLTIIGGGILTVMPDVIDTYGTTDAAFPAFIIEYFPPVVAGIAISALMAAILSTINSMLLVGTTHLVYDAGQALFPDIDDDQFMRTIPAATVIVGVVITFVSLQITSLSNVLYFAVSLGGAAFACPMLLILYWSKISKWGVTLGVCIGALSVIIMSALDIAGPGGDPVYLGLALSLVSCVLGSLLIPGDSQSDDL